MDIKPIAHIHTDFKTKFGIPRQSGIIAELKGEIIFEPEYRNIEAVRGLEDFSHIWLIWEFSENVRDGFSPTVRPPRLGGNVRMGVFATRSPFRPNPIGLSCVKLESVNIDSKRGPILHIKGADLMDGTPIYDIKPYVPIYDSHPDASESFAGPAVNHKLDVIIPTDLLEILTMDKRQAVIDILAQDPRPSYQSDESRIYGMAFSDFDIQFKVCNDTLTVVNIIKNARTL